MTQHNQTSGEQPVEKSVPLLVASDPEVMGGWACFTGTRVPVSMVVKMLDSGTAWSDLLGAYPFLTEAHIAAARAYLETPGNPGKEPTNWLGLPQSGDGLRLVKVHRRSGSGQS